MIWKDCSLKFNIKFLGNFSLQPCILIIIIIVYFRYVYNLCFSLVYFFVYSCIGKRLTPEPYGYIQVELGGLINNDTSGMRCSKQ